MKIGPTVKTLDTPFRSLINSIILIKPGHLGELLPWDSGRTLLLNSHGFEQQDAQMLTKVILLVRNPYLALSAEYNRREVEEGGEQVLDFDEEG